MKEIRVVMENKVGALASLCRKLGGSGINIESIVAYEQDGHGIARLITADVESTVELLKKGRYDFTALDIMTHKINDTPGELAKVADRLANHSVNIESLYIVGKSKGVVELALKVDSEKNAKLALGAK
jgi:hypothetical protein